MGRLNEVTTRGGLAGIFAAFTLMSLLPEGLGWQVAFTGFSVLTLLAAVLAWKSVPVHGATRQPAARRQALPKQLLRLLIIVLILGVPEAMLSPIYLTYLQDKYTTSMETLAWAFFPAGVVAAVFSARLGSLSDRFGRVPMMAAGLAGAGVLSLLMPHLPSLSWLAVLYTLTAVMWSISEPAETALVADLTGSQRRGLAYGLYDFAENLGFAIGPILGGMIYDGIGRAVPFYLNGVVLIVGAVLVLVLLERVPQNSGLKNRPSSPGQAS